MPSNLKKPLTVITLLLLSGTCFAATNQKTIAITKPTLSKKEPLKTEIYNEDKQNIVLSNETGPEFSIQLKSNPTTGYSWFLREYNSDLITPISHQFLPPEKKLIGASGAEVWTFRVNKVAFAVPTQTTLRLIYTRPWQGSDMSNQINFRITTVARQ